ncbi:MAG: hypothetical protein PWQ10_23 [Patescibacteria group bacterium]|nr:hypothetical protein [Patescibacteria group bacterium]
MNVCIFCSSNNLENKYLEPAKKLANMFISAKYNMVYGGSDYGLMQFMADIMQEGGRKIIGVTIPVYAEDLREKADEKIIAKDLSDRKRIILDRSDAIVVLIGGIGTIDELFEVMELKRQGCHDKPIIVLNTDGFYDGLIMQLNRIEKENLFKAGDDRNKKISTLSKFIQFVDTPEQAMEIINRHL